MSVGSRRGGVGSGDKRMRSAGENGASDLDFRKKSERHFRSVCIALLASLASGGLSLLLLQILNVRDMYHLQPMDQFSEMT